MRSDAPALPYDLRLARLVQQALTEPPRRIRLLNLPDGRRFWLKRIERLSLIQKMQKGDPAKAFLAEKRALHYLLNRGIPVAELMAEGPDYMLLADAGQNLRELAVDERMSKAERLRIFAAAGQALAGLHCEGLAHGRPAVRDLCWDGRMIRFIDLENFHPGRSSTYRQARDLLALSHSADTQWADRPEWIETLLAAYFQDGPVEVRAFAAQMGRRLGLFMPLVELVSRIRHQSREVKAIAMTVERMKRLD